MTNTPITDSVVETTRSPQKERRVPARPFLSGQFARRLANHFQRSRSAGVPVVKRAPTPTELATRAFYEQVKQIFGLVKVEARCGKSWRTKSILVVVPDLFSDTADKVSTLTGDISGLSGSQTARGGRRRCHIWPGQHECEYRTFVFEVKTMPDSKSLSGKAQEHIEDAFKNYRRYEQFLQEPDNVEWAVVFLFYSAVHLVQAHAAEKYKANPRQSPRDHATRDSYIAQELQEDEA